MNKNNDGGIDFVASSCNQWHTDGDMGDIDNSKTNFRVGDFEVSLFAGNPSVFLCLRVFFLILNGHNVL